MLYESVEKVKYWIKDNKADLYTALVIFLVGLGSFGLGRLSAVMPGKEPVRIEQVVEFASGSEESKKEISGGTGESKSETVSNQTAATVLSSIKGKYVASKNGTAYHLPWCSGALKIKEENKIWFDTKEEAEKRGYKPAGNCAGL